MTPQEIFLWKYLKGNNLGFKFQRQYGMGKYIVDFYCPNKKFVIEIDGIQHNDNRDREYDEERTKYLESLNCKVLRFWNNEINTNMDGVLESIRRELNHITLVFDHPSYLKRGKTSNEK